MAIKFLKGVIPVVFVFLFFKWIHAPDPRIENFFDAVERGDAAAAEKMLNEARGLALSARGMREREPRLIVVSGETPLHVAARSAREHESHYEICRLLIGRGADVNALKITRNEESTFYSTSLLELFGPGGISTGARLKILEFLISAGAETGHRGKDGRSALEAAESMRDEGLNEKAVQILKGHAGTR